MTSIGRSICVDIGDLESRDSRLGGMLVYDLFESVLCAPVGLKVGEGQVASK